MTRITTIATAAAMTLVLGLPAAATAQQPDTRDRTIMTFSAPVELPGMRLEAGTYVWKLADTASRNVIQVFTQGEKEILGQWLFIPAERREVTGDTVVTFREASAGSTPAVQYWFYPGESIGKEFIYPKDQAMRIARRTGATIQTDDGPVTADVATAETQVAPARPVATEGRTAQSEAPAQTTAGSGRVEVQQESTTARGFGSDELPRTASPLALTSLLAALSLGGVAVFRRFRR